MEAETQIYEHEGGNANEKCFVVFVFFQQYPMSMEGSLNFQIKIPLLILKSVGISIRFMKMKTLILSFLLLMFM